MFGKKSLNDILGVFTKVKSDLEAFVVSNQVELDDLSAQILVKAKEKKTATTTLSHLSKILGEDTSL